jgi:hypothetical protein
MGLPALQLSSLMGGVSPQRCTHGRQVIQCRCISLSGYLLSNVFVKSLGIPGANTPSKLKLQFQTSVALSIQAPKDNK